MSLYNFLTPGFDPTTVTTPTNSQLLQMVQEARPAATTGMLVFADSAPDCVAYPDLARAHWEKTVAGVRTGLRYYYNGVAWVPDPVQPGVIEGVSFSDGTIPVAKLIGGEDTQLLQTVAGIPIWVWPADIFTADLVPLSALRYVSPAAADYVPLTDSSGQYVATKFATRFATELGSSTVPIVNISDTTNIGAANMVPALDAVGGFCTPRYPDELLRAGKVGQNKLTWETRTATIASGLTAIDGQVAAAWYLDLTANVTALSVSLADGQTVTLAVKQTGAFTMAYDSSIKWSGGLKPTVSTTVGVVDVFTFVKVGGIIYATVIQNFS